MPSLISSIMQDSVSLFHWISDRAGEIGAILIAGGLLAPVGRKGWRWVRTVHDTVKKVQAVPPAEEIAELLTLTRRIAAQLQPNGGTSVVDTLSKIGNRLTIIERFQHAIVMDATQGIWRADANGECTFINRTLAALVGRGFEDFRGNNWMAVVCEQDREDVVGEWESAVRYRRDFHMEYGLDHQNGELVMVRGDAMAVIDEAGQLLGYVGTITPM